jgi:hypothetical protein
MLVWFIKPDQFLVTVVSGAFGQSDTHGSRFQERSPFAKQN